MGLGAIFQENIMLYYLRTNDLYITLSDLIYALAFPIIGMTISLLIAFIRYGKPRYYKDTRIIKVEKEIKISRRDLIVSCLAGVAA
jgi:predicted histidine transporter YuiF (NhaC family)